jgi:inosine-uridine nucleoside N-ribohydrolase
MWGYNAMLNNAVMQMVGSVTLSVHCLEQGLVHSLSAAHFLVDMCARYPGQVTILALGPLTNIAMAMNLDASIVDNMVRYPI